MAEAEAMDHDEPPLLQQRKTAEAGPHRLTVPD
jgi:hypothetical protein